MCPFAVRVPCPLSLADFLGGTITHSIGSSRRTHRTIGFQLQGRICLSLSAPTAFNLLFRQEAVLSHPRHHVTGHASAGMLTGSSIGRSVRMSLRSRLTLIRLALIRKPWSCGEGESHPLYRYLYLHLLFQKLHRKLSFRLQRRWNAPLPMSYDIPRLRQWVSYPIIIHAQSLD